MKIITSIAILLVAHTACSGQNFTSITGDWMRVKAEYQDNQALPRNHFARYYQRYSFEKDKVYLIGGSQAPAGYQRVGSTLNIGPQSFIIEKYTDKMLTLVEAGEENPLRFYLIPTDSFQRSGAIRYPYTVSNADTIYTSATGIEPIYRDNETDFMHFILQGFDSSVAFDFTFVVQKDGTIGEVKVVKTANEKRNKRLIQMVKKTSGKWIPATYKGKPINVEMKSNLSLNKGY